MIMTKAKNGLLFMAIVYKLMMEALRCSVQMKAMVMPPTIGIYRNFHYFRSQVFHVRNFGVTILSSISRMRHIFATYNTIGK